MSSSKVLKAEYDLHTQDECVNTSELQLENKILSNKNKDFHLLR